VGARVDRIIEEMEPGLERAVARILEKRTGQERAVQKPELLKLVRSLGFGGQLAPATLERQVRMAIVSLRKSGVLVCSSSGEGGYYLAGSRVEYEEFIEREYAAKIRDMADTKSAMDRAARAQFGEGVQMGLGL
jgi:hypothetical protein